MWKLENLAWFLDRIVRPLVCLAFVGGFIWGFATSLIPSETFVGLTSVVVTWYFRKRDEEKRDSTEPVK
jgi:hypothetical protein